MIIDSQTVYKDFFPDFSSLKKYKDNTKNTMQFKFDMMIEVAMMKGIVKIHQ